MDLTKLWDFSDPAGSEARFRVAAAERGGRDAALALTQVARALGLQERFDEAHAVLDGICASEAADAEVAARIALERGRLARSAGDAEAARPEFAAAARLATEAGLENLAIDAAHMVALTLDGAEQVVATELAVEAARAAATDEGRDWLPSLLNNLGMALTGVGEWERALVVFEEALQLRRARGNEDATHVAGWMVAWSLRNLGRTEEALRMQLELRAALESRGEQDSYVDEEIALLRGQIAAGPIEP